MLPIPRPEDLPISPRVKPKPPPEKEGEGEGEKKDGATARGKTGPKAAKTAKTAKTDKTDKTAKATKPAKPAEEEMTPALYYKKVQKLKWSEVIGPARQVLEKRAARPMASAPRGRSIADIMNRSMGYAGQPAYGHTAPPPAVIYAPARPAQAPATGLFPSLFRSATRTTPVQASQTVVETPTPISQPLRTTPMPATTTPMPAAPTQMPVMSTAPVTHIEQEQPRTYYSTASPMPQPVTRSCPTSCPVPSPRLRRSRRQPRRWALPSAPCRRCRVPRRCRRPKRSRRPRSPTARR
jgi:hypothetical protein